MQLFSIGLYRLHSNGTRVTDDDGVELQTYTTPDIENFAKVWTGVSYDTCVRCCFFIEHKICVYS